MPIPIPPINATITRIWAIEDTGETDIYGNSIISEVERWSGSMPAYSTEKNDRVPISGGGATLVYTATLSIPASLTVQAGDFIDWLRNGVERHSEVDATEDRSDAGFTRTFIRDAG